MITKTCCKCGRTVDYYNADPPWVPYAGWWDFEEGYDNQFCPKGGRHEVFEY